MTVYGMKGFILGVVIGLLIGFAAGSVLSAHASNAIAEERSLDCLATMETAMRAREEWAGLTDEQKLWVTVGTESLTLMSTGLTTIQHASECCIPYDNMLLPEYEPDRRTEEERLADEQKALDERKIALAKRREEQRIKAERAQEKAGRIIVLKAQWERGKSCWRQ